MAFTLFVDGYFCNPWDATCFVAFAEKQAEFATSRAMLRDKQHFPPTMYERTPIVRVPTLSHGDFWLSESSAIVDYIEDVVPPQPLLLPADPRSRARARQVMAWLRIELQTLRTERPFTNAIYTSLPYAPLSEPARQEAGELLDVIARLDRAGDLAEWTIAQADLALTLFRLKPEDVELPAAIQRMFEANLARPSVRSYLDHTRPPHPPPDAQRTLRLRA